MDFHSLSRRELQALCKRNKIPANITNIAMADALKALETVEDLEEIMNHFQSNPAPSPASRARTATRTARRKTIEEDTQISQTASRSCRVTRKALDKEMDQENNSADVGDAKPDAKLEAIELKTPAAQSTRRRGRPAASLRKPETHESVQTAYSTRRSVRLLEKSMADLTLNGKRTTEPVKNDEFVETNEKVKDLTGAEESETIPGRDLTSTLEKEWGMRDKHQDNFKSDGPAVPECKTVTLSSDKSVIIEDVSVLAAKAETKEHKVDEVGTCLNEELAQDASDRKEWDMRDKHQDNDKSDEATVLECKTVTFSSNESVIIDDISALAAKADSEEDKMNEVGTCLTEELAQEASDGTLLFAFLNVHCIISGSDGIPVFENLSEVGNEETKSEEVLDFSESMAMNNSFIAFPVAAELIENAKNNEKTIAEEEASDEITDNLSPDVNTNEESGCESESSKADSDQEVESGQDASTESDQSDTDADFEMDSDETVAGFDIALSDADLQGISDPEKLIFDQLEEQDEVQSSEESNKFDDDASETESEIKMTFSKEETEEAQDQTEDPASDKIQDSPLVMDSGCKERTPLSPFTAESISSQFPRPNLSSTPGKSSVKKLKSSQKLTVIADITNSKENFDNDGIVIKTEQAKKTAPKKMNNEVDEEVLKGASLRQLTKMVKELQLKSRPALQKLPGNQIVEESRKE